MFELVKAGGWAMIPLLLCSVVSMAIVLERLWSLQRRRVMPDNLVAMVWQWTRAGVLDDKRIEALSEGSPLGRILAAGLRNRSHGREIMKECIEEVGRHVVHELTRYLTTLGTIATISPLLGLLGTVLGMIKIFGAVSIGGMGDPLHMAGGISQALITTVSGLVVAIPSLIAYRHLRGHVEGLVVDMEQEALKMVEVLRGERERGAESAAEDSR